MDHSKSTHRTQPFTMKVLSSTGSIMKNLQTHVDTDEHKCLKEFGVFHTREAAKSMSLVATSSGGTHRTLHHCYFHRTSRWELTNFKNQDLA